MPRASRTGAKRGGKGSPQFSVSTLRGAAKDIQALILRGRMPFLRFPQRSLGNVRYSDKVGFFELGAREVERTLTLNTVKTFAQTLKMMALSKELIEKDDIATKREAYYVSKNWDDARFDDQPESDAVMEDVEAFFRVNR
jgi:DNA topoisomerase-6 subunit A